MTKRELLRLEHVSKRSGGISVLDDLCLMALSGEQLQITGLSGSGIEELGQLLSGQTSFDGGRILFGDTYYTPGQLLPAEELGIYAIFNSNSNMVPQLTVAENIFLLRPRAPFLFTPSRRTINRQARSLLDEFGLDIPPDAPVHSLRLVERQALDFVKAYARNARMILAYDCAGPYPEQDTQLFNKVTQRMREADIAVLSISSTPFGFFDRYDRSIVLRYGTQSKTIYPQLRSRENPMKYAVAGELPEPGPRQNHREGITAFRCFDLRSGRLPPLNFALHRGEIVGLFDSDSTDLPLAVENLLTGAARPDGGYMLLGGHRFAPKNLEQAVKAGLGYIRGNDPAGQLIGHVSVAENILLPSMRKAPRLGVLRNAAAEHSLRALLDDGQLRGLADTLVQDLPDSADLTRALILYHRWGVYRPRLLLYSDPFSKTDAVLRAQLLGQIEHLTALGIAVLVLSPRLRDLVYLCDRILVYKNGVFIREHQKQDNLFPDLSQPYM